MDEASVGNEIIAVTMTFQRGYWKWVLVRHWERRKGILW